MKCSDCNYYYQDENNEYAHYHFEDYWMAQCEYDDNYEEDN